MDFGTIVQQVAGPFIVAAAAGVGSFIVAVGLDDLAGVALAIKKREFDWSKLPSFLASQFGTQEAAALAGLVVTAGTAAVGSALLHGGVSSQALQAVSEAAAGAATAGAAAMMLAVLADLSSKVSQLFGAPVLPAPAPEPAKT